MTQPPHNNPYRQAPHHGLAQDFDDLDYEYLALTDGVPPLSEPYYTAPFTEAVSRFYRKAFRFKGYASRREFWYAMLFQVLAYVGLVMFLARTISNWTPLLLGMGIFTIINIIPNLAILWRRLHDIGLPGVIALVYFVPGIGHIALLIMTVWPTNFEGRRLEWEDY